MKRCAAEANVVDVATRRVLCQGATAPEQYASSAAGASTLPPTRMRSTFLQTACSRCRRCKLHTHGRAADAVPKQYTKAFCRHSLARSRPLAVKNCKQGWTTPRLPHHLLARRVNGRSLSRGGLAVTTAKKWPRGARPLAIRAASMIAVRHRKTLVAAPRRPG